MVGWPAGSGLEIVDNGMMGKRDRKETAEPTGDGRLMSRSVTGLCKQQQFRITKFVKMAQKAGLMPGKDLGWRQYSTRVPT